MNRDELITEIEARIKILEEQRAVAQRTGMVYAKNFEYQLSAYRDCLRLIRRTVR